MKIQGKSNPDQAGSFIPPDSSTGLNAGQQTNQFTKPVPIPDMAPPPTESVDPNRLYFAYAASDGKRLKLLGPILSDPNSLTYLVSPDGSKSKVSYLKTQRRTEKDNGRQNAWNFDNEQGMVYWKEGTELREDESFVLCASRFLESRSLIPVLPFKGKKDFPKKMELENSMKRKIRQAWGIAKLGPGAELYWVIFHHQGDNALACVVLCTPLEISTLEFSGDARRGDIWRVGDGGEPIGEDFTVLFAAIGPEGLEFAYEWNGEEGSNLDFVKQAGMKLKEVKKASSGRYHMAI